MRKDLEVQLFRKPRYFRKHLGRTSLGSRGAQTPFHQGRALRERAFDEIKLCSDVARGGQTPKRALRQCVPVGNAVATCAIGNLERQNGPDVEFFVRLDELVDVSLIAAHNRDHILNGRYSVEKALRCTESGAGLNHVLREVGELTGAAVKHPRVDGQLFKHPSQQCVVRVIVCVHQPRNN